MIASKLCTKCKKDLPVDSFCKRRDNKSTGLASDCKLCHRETVKLWRINNPQKYKESRGRSNRKTYQRILNSPELKERQRRSNREHYHRNLEEQRLRGKIYRSENKEKERARHYKHYIKNKERYHLKNKIGRLRRHVSNPIYRLRETASAAIRKALHLCFASKDSPTWENMPYTPEQLRLHLESLWEPWMNWENYGKHTRNGPRTWNIDHIIPQSKLPFDSFRHPNFLKCWALENLRPLCSKANKEKNNKIC